MGKKSFHLFFKLAIDNTLQIMVKYVWFNLSHQGVLPNRARRKSQWKTGHHFRAEAVEYLRAGGSATQKMAQSILVPAAHAGSTPHSYKVHRPEHSLCKVMVKSGLNHRFIF